jgi:hypothetical protein
LRLGNPAHRGRRSNTGASVILAQAKAAFKGKKGSKRQEPLLVSADFPGAGHRNITDDFGVVELVFRQGNAQTLQRGDERGTIKRTVLGFDIEAIARSRLDEPIP